MTKRRTVRFALLGAIGAVALTAATAVPVGADSITSPDTTGFVGQYSSLALDAAGNPVVAYYGNGDLKILHCDDPSCAAGGDSITTPDTAGIVGTYPSLALDAAGNPVVAYIDAGNDDLKILHCDDPNCASGGDSVTTPDASGLVSYGASLSLDAAGNPVVGYRTTGGAALLHCDDPNCSGGGESIEAVPIDLLGGVALDGSGYPVLTGRGSASSDFAVVHCNDADCAGGDESVTNPVTVPMIANSSAVTLDAAGNPVVVVFNGVNNKLQVVHCNDADCAGGDESVETVTNAIISTPSIALDAAGNPVVTYYDDTPEDLKLLRCDDPNCAGTGETITTLDMAGDVGFYGSLALDAAGHPVVSYFDGTNLDLKLYRAGVTLPSCVAVPKPTDLAGWWDFDGDYSDRGGVFPTGVTSSSGVTLNPVAHVEGSAGFSGGNVTVSDAALGLGAGGLSVDAWVKRSAGGSGTQVLVGHRDANAGSPGFLWFLFNNKPAVQLWTGTSAINVVAPTLTVPIDSDYHLVATTVSAAGEVTFYVDDQTPETVSSSGVGSRDALGEELTIGADFDGSDAFHGEIDELEIFSTVLDAADITALHDADAEGKCIPVGFCAGAPVTVDWATDPTATTGDDVIWGTTGDDTINAFGGDDIICGRGGDDILTGAGGDDTIDGGAGNDTIVGHPGNDTINGGTGNDTINGGAGNDIVRGEADLDTIVGGPGDDDISGGTGDDDINGAIGEDTLRGEDGDDTIRGAGGNDTIYGGDGDDPLLSGGAATDTVHGGSGNDNLQGNKGHNDALFGEAGGDTLNGGTGADALDGGAGIDLCNGGTDGHTDAAASCETLINIP